MCATCCRSISTQNVISEKIIIYKLTNTFVYILTKYAMHKCLKCNAHSEFLKQV